MEFLSEPERYEQGALSKECEAMIAVAAMQRLFNLWKEETDERED